MAATHEHVVKSFDQDLKRLKNLLAEMGGIVESQMALAAQAILQHDAAGATRAVEADPRVDALEREVE
jgi:phosphate transport system protein